MRATSRRNKCRSANATMAGLKRALLVLAALTACAMLAPGSALAAGGPSWNVTSFAAPTFFPPNSPGNTPNNKIAGSNTIVLQARNLGDVTVDGSSTPVTVNVEHLSGIVSPTEVAARVMPRTSDGELFIPGAGTALNCIQPAGPCTYEGIIEPGSAIWIELGVAAGGETGRGTLTATVSGGVDQQDGVAMQPATVSVPIVISATPASFGIQPDSIVAEFNGSEGNPYVQAGGHPYALSFGFVLNNENSHIGSSGEVIAPTGVLRDVVVELPPGLAGNEKALPQCTQVSLTNGACPGASQVGSQHTAVAIIGLSARQAVFNMEPQAGHTNELGFSVTGAVPIRVVNSVRTGDDYGITSTVSHIPSNPAQPLGQSLQVWGVPGDSSHDYQRVLEGWNASEGSGANAGGHGPGVPAQAFLTMPSECGQPLQIKVAVDSYEHPGRLNPSTGEPDLSDPNWKVYPVTLPAMTGCEALAPFQPTLKLAPDTTISDTPTALTVNLSVPHDPALTEPEGIAAPTLQDTTVTLPQGLSINPGQADGLGACQASEDGVGTTQPPSCPADSKVGTVTIETPLLPDKLEGDVYVLQSNPPHLKLLVAASGDGVNLKLVGEVDLNTSTGQLTTTFSGTPQLPFSDFKLTFNGGAHAALSTPLTCGTYAADTLFTPWSSPLTANFDSVNAFAIEGAPSGGGCHGPLPFNASLTAGSTSDRAGAHTDFSMLLRRGDGQQRVGALQFNTPQGLLGLVKSVPLCHEPQAAQGACPAASQIGHTVVAAGPGPYPLIVPAPGAPPAPVYLTGPYKGAPYGLSIAVPVIAGPFNLGTVVVRAAIAVNPHTAQLTITTDPLPRILDGVPTDLRTIDAVIDRPGFMINPTDCKPMAFSGTAVSYQGAKAPLSSRFEVGSCAGLKFRPRFTASTSAKASRKRGASLDVRVSFPKGALGADANIAKVKVKLPRQLPSRLETLKQACLASTFEEDPASCPAASVVGIVKARTPVLSGVLKGPAYFVSHGGAQFPSLIIVLQGDGVRVDLEGETYISKAGITTSTFNTVPDVPVESFELYLPRGKYSALAAPGGKLCRRPARLIMPTEIVAQNGAIIHQKTKIHVRGCGRSAHAHSARHRHRHRRGHRHHGHGHGNPKQRRRGK